MGTPVVSHRLRLAHPGHFQPRAIVFSDYPAQISGEWIECFPLKAAAVYSALVGRDADDDGAAFHLLTLIADYCCSETLPPAAAATGSRGVLRAQGDDSELESLPIEVHKPARSGTEEEEERRKALEETERLPKESKQMIDAVYLVAGFLRDISGVDDREKLDRNAGSRHGRDIISDVAMVENQVPLQLLMAVAKNISGAVKAYRNQLLAKRIFQEGDPIAARIEKFAIPTEDELVSVFCWYYSPFHVAKRRLFARNRWEKERHLLGCLHSSLQRKTGKSTPPGSAIRRQTWPTPTAKELLRVGVRFEAEAVGEATVAFSKPVLRLPVLFLDSKLETVVLNLLAVEREAPATGSKPVTRYFQMMNELIDDAGDVRVLAKAGVIRGRWRRDEDVVDLVKRVDGFASYSSLYPPMDVGIARMKEFYRERAGKFTVKHRPAMAWVSTLAAASFVLMAILTSKRKD